MHESSRLSFAQNIFCGSEWGLTACSGMPSQSQQWWAGPQLSVPSSWLPTHQCDMQWVGLPMLDSTYKRLSNRISSGFCQSPGFLLLIVQTSCTSWYGKYPSVYRVLAPSQVVVWDFFFHQPYQPTSALEMELSRQKRQKLWIISHKKWYEVTHKPSVSSFFWGGSPLPMFNFRGKPTRCWFQGISKA